MSYSHCIIRFTTCIVLMAFGAGCGLHSTKQWKNGNARYRFCQQQLYKYPLAEMINELRKQGMAEFMAPNLEDELHSSNYRSIRWVDDVEKLNSIIQNNRLRYNGLNLNDSKTLQERYRRYSAEMQLLRTHPVIRDHAGNYFYDDRFLIGEKTYIKDKTYFFGPKEEDELVVKYERLRTGIRNEPTVSLYAAKKRYAMGLNGIRCDQNTWYFLEDDIDQLPSEIKLPEIVRLSKKNHIWVWRREKLHYLDLNKILDDNYRLHIYAIHDEEGLQEYHDTARSDRGKQIASERLCKEFQRCQQ